MSDRPPDSVASITSTPPLRAQLWHKDLKPEELLVLFAMLEIGDSTGQFLYPSVVRIADYTKLAKRTVQKVFHGERREGRAVYVGLIERRVLVRSHLPMPQSAEQRPIVCRSRRCETARAPNAGDRKSFVSRSTILTWKSGSTTTPEPGLRSNASCGWRPRPE
jgi:hypothetical protein